MRSGLLLGTAMCLGFGGAAHAAGHLPGVFNGNANAAFAEGTDFATQMGATAQQYCGCNGTDGKVQQVTTGAISAGPLASLLAAGGTVSAVSTRRTASSAEATNWSEIDNLNLLGGMISADAVKATAHFTVTKNAYTLSAGDSAFTNLKVAGKAYKGTPAPNTVIPIPNVGKVVLNAQSKHNSSFEPGIDVNLISIRITNPNGFTLPGVPIPVGLPIPAGVTLPAGTVINIGHASAGYNRQQPKAAVSGGAFATLAAGQLGAALRTSIGRAAAVSIGCEGTGGSVIKNSADSVNALNVVDVSNAKSTAQSGSRSGGTFAHTVSTVQSFNILGGLIHGTNLTASAQETLTNGKLTPATTGSGFDQMTIAGVPVPTKAAPNTGRAIPGLGKVIVNEQVKGKNPGDLTTVNGLHITVMVPNAMKLPLGAEIFVAHAEAAVAPLTP